MKYQEGQEFTLKKDVQVAGDFFSKGSTAKIYSITKDSIFPYNILFVEKAVLHMAFDDWFIDEHFTPIPFMMNYAEY